MQKPGVSVHTWTQALTHMLITCAQSFVQMHTQGTPSPCLIPSAKLEGGIRQPAPLHPCLELPVCLLSLAFPSAPPPHPNLLHEKVSIGGGLADQALPGRETP